MQAHAVATVDNDERSLNRHPEREAPDRPCENNLIVAIWGRSLSAFFMMCTKPNGDTGGVPVYVALS